MSLPGLTAEASLYRSGRNYQAAARASRTSAEAIAPQIGLGDGRSLSNFVCLGDRCWCAGSSSCADLAQADLCKSDASCFLGFCTCAAR